MGWVRGRWVGQGRVGVCEITEITVGITEITSVGPSRGRYDMVW